MVCFLALSSGSSSFFSFLANGWLVTGFTAPAACWALPLHLGRIFVVTSKVDTSHSCCYIKSMIIEFDTVKREKTLLERGLDFADADKVFAGLHFIARDDRVD